MGFFSWQCAKSKKPVMSTYAVNRGPFEFASRVVVLFKNGDRISGTYDGYGRVDGIELVDYPESAWRMVIERYYEGEAFEELAMNPHDPGQGYFYSDEDLKEIFPDAQSVVK